MKENQAKNSVLKNQKQQQQEVQQIIDKYQGKQLGKNYFIKEYLNNGSFCVVFKALYQKFEETEKDNNNMLNNSDNNSLSYSHSNSYSNKKVIKQKWVCLKVEDYSRQGKNKSCTLEREANILRHFSSEVGFPKLYYFQKNKNSSFMITSLLGKSLLQLHKDCEKKFSVKTLCMIAYQVLQRLEVLHDKGFLHRDIKPDNLMIGYNENQQKVIYMIDYGLSTTYLKKDGSHIKYKKNVGSIGTMRYNSINCHKRDQQSRRDDLESFGYVLVYLFKGNLPWQVIQNQDFWQRNDAVLAMKQEIQIEYLCRGLPEAFLKYFQYIKELDFYDKPDYKLLRGLFQKIIVQHNWNVNFKFDWEDSQLRRKTINIEKHNQGYSQQQLNTMNSLTSLNNTHNRQKSYSSFTHNNASKLKLIGQQVSSMNDSKNLGNSKHYQYQRFNEESHFNENSNAKMSIFEQNSIYRKSSIMSLGNSELGQSQVDMISNKDEKHLKVNNNQLALNNSRKQNLNIVRETTMDIYESQFDAVENNISQQNSNNNNNNQNQQTTSNSKQNKLKLNSIKEQQLDKFNSTIVDLSSHDIDDDAIISDEVEKVLKINNFIFNMKKINKCNKQH